MLYSFDYPRLIVSSENLLLRDVSKPLSGIPLLVNTVKIDGVYRLVELLIYLLGLCSINMVINLVNNHPPSDELLLLAGMIDWDSRITQLRFLSSYGLVWLRYTYLEVSYGRKIEYGRKPVLNSLGHNWGANTF